MKAIILAAGRGSRLKNVIGEKPKSLIKINRKTLIEYSLDALSKAGIKEVIMVIGYKGNMIKKTLGDFYKNLSIRYVENLQYAKTDTMYSLYKTKDLIDEDVIILEADLLYEEDLIEKIISSKIPNFLILSDLTNSGDEVFVSSRDRMNIDKIGKKIEKKDIIGEFIGISKLSYNFLIGVFNYFEKDIIHRARKNWCEDIFVEFSQKFHKPLAPFLIKYLIWTEIDKPQDLEKARNEIFSKIDLKNKNVKIEKILDDLKKKISLLFKCLIVALGLELALIIVIILLLIFS